MVVRVITGMPADDHAEVLVIEAHTIGRTSDALKRIAATVDRGRYEGRQTAMLTPGQRSHEFAHLVEKSGGENASARVGKRNVGHI
jgi:hypothetical protein